MSKAQIWLMIFMPAVGIYVVFGFNRDEDCHISGDAETCTDRWSGDEVTR